MNKKLLGRKLMMRLCVVVRESRVGERGVG